ncbi:Hypothetical protein ABNV54_00703 [Enterococcus faecalis]
MMNIYQKKMGKVMKVLCGKRSDIRKRVKKMIPKFIHRTRNQSN